MGSRHIETSFKRDIMELYDIGKDNFNVLFIVERSVNIRHIRKPRWQRTMSGKFSFINQYIRFSGLNPVLGTCMCR